MVLQKKLYYGFNGYQGPPMPRRSRSARGRRSFPKENPMFAIEMLAMVAGKLLLEKESPPLSSSVPGCSKQLKSTIKQEFQENQKAFKLEPCDKKSCDESTLASEYCHEKNFENLKLKECLQDSNIMNKGPVCLKSKGSAELKCPVLNNANKDSFATLSENFSVEFHVTKLGDCMAGPQLTDHQNVTNCVDGDVLNLLCMEDPMLLDTKVPTLDGSDSSIEAPLNVTCIYSSQFSPGDCGYANLVDRDDDKNSSRCIIPSTILSKSFRGRQHPKVRKVRKLASRFWKSGPTLLKDGESLYNDEQVKSIFHNRKMCYSFQRSQRSSFKRKKLVRHCPIKARRGLENGARYDYALPDVDCKNEANFASTVSCGDQSPWCKSDDCQVKYSIESIKVPEIFIELPETATVGAVKQSVLDTLTAILHDGARVGIIFQGEKVKNDKKTLLQSGLSSRVKSDSLDFYLEPKCSLPRLTGSDGLHFFRKNGSIELLSRLPAADFHLPSSTYNMKKHHRKCPVNYVKSVNKPATEPSANYTANIENSEALVPIHCMGMETMAMVPFQRKSRQSEYVQRRIRRPFSVTEVEALVEAVEVLGSGRWCDVKHRAFEEARHRTYVDLKDKWKTLVHTASISPHQRRGEPVPQGLLDRVLIAHTYWSHQQAKHQVTQPPDQDLLL